MSTGISISSVNRIKELAEEKKFAEALEILDTQNLDKSINPQFLRISGEIFRENKRYYDSRKILLKAHQMSPQGLRIIAELIQLYLELGYFTKAKCYYDQYLFYTTPEDTQREYVEYIMKKGTGADVKELASILIPILERLPEERWNFEAVLLYDKLNRKDKALDESRYILENFKNSIYVQPAIDYIEDKLDVDAYFYVYPKDEAEEERALYGDLIEEEEKLLEADHLRMYPPEAKIMVEAEDKEGIDIKPAKEKKVKKKKSDSSGENESGEADDTQTGKKNSKRKKKQTKVEVVEEKVDTESSEMDNTSAEDDGQSAITTDNDDDSDSAGNEDNTEQISEEKLKKEREAALEKLLSKKINTEQIKESAVKAAKAVKEIDTNKAKEQVKTVAKTVKGNVKKATDVLGEAVGVKNTDESTPDSISKQPTEIVDGIIESVLEPPKKAVGEVVTNQELDSLIPESLESMSTSEIEDLEAKKEEAERLEQEAIEAQLKYEEEKKAKSHIKKSKLSMDSDIVPNLSDADNRMVSVSSEEFIQLKEQFLATEQGQEEEETPLESLGFISVVQSDVDAKMEAELPDAAGILHQMIDNKEFYTGEDSTKFESKASYENHGFEIEDYAFETFEDSVADTPTQAQLYDNSLVEDKDVPTVEVIYAQEEVVDFSEIIPEQQTTVAEESKVMTSESVIRDVQDAESIIENENQWTGQVLESDTVWNTTQSAEQEFYADDVVEEMTEHESLDDIAQTEENEILDDVVETEENETLNDVVEIEENESLDDVAEEEADRESLDNDVVEEAEYNEAFEDNMITEAEEDVQTGEVEEKTAFGTLSFENRRQLLRVRILITEDMTRKLMDLKESR